MKTKIVLSVFMSLVVATSTFAQMRTGDNIVINDVVNDDLYVAGGMVTINAPIHGDLIIAGGTIIVDDTVSQDILIAGGNILLKGYVGDDVRCAGGTVEISNSIKGDLIATGGVITVGKNSNIGGYILASGGETTVHGKVDGKVESASGEFTLTGSVGEDLDARGGKIFIDGIVNGNSILAANTIEVGSGARFEKDVRYWNKKGTLDFNSALTGTAAYDPDLIIEDGKWHYLGFASFLAVLWYLGTALLMIILIQYLFRNTFRNAANTIRNLSAKSLGYGFLFIVGVPVAAIICFITIIPIPVGVLLLIGYVTLLILATAITAVLISNWINNTYYDSSWGDGRIMLAAFGIFIFLKLFSLTPVVGPIIMLLLAAMGFGGILLTIKWRRNKALAMT